MSEQRLPSPKGKNRVLRYAEEHGFATKYAWPFATSVRCEGNSPGTQYLIRSVWRVAITACTPF